MTAAVNALDGYRRWASSYSDETAISFLEDRLVSTMTPALGGLRLLDAGCGTGRRLRDCGAGSAAGLDASSEMLAAGVAKDGPPGEIELVVGDVRAMPFGVRAFDVVWCRLVLGHLPGIDEAYAELARVADVGATVIVSDFHPAAHDAGHRRSFRAGGQLVELEHHVHRLEEHVEAAQRAGLALNDVREAEIGNDVREFYDRAGKGGAYPDHVGLPVVLALSLRREC
jgi:malonyl-CoA O-methyltransferase